jgi:membrane associated rhomboid family serine protease
VAFTNALAVSLFGLVPHNLIGYPAAVAGVVGLLFVLGGLRSILADPASRPRARSQIGLILLLLAAFGVEVVAGVIAAANPHEKVPIAVIGNVLVASLLIGVARSWELVGDRDTGITASIAALAGHERHLGGSVAGPADVPRDDDAAWPGEAALPGEAPLPGEPASPGDAAAPGNAAPPGEAAGRPGPG